MPTTIISYENPEICISDPESLKEHLTEHIEELQYRLQSHLENLIDLYDEDGDEMYPEISSFRIVQFDSEPNDDENPDDEWRSVTAEISIRYNLQYV